MLSTAKFDSVAEYSPCGCIARPVQTYSQLVADMLCRRVFDMTAFWGPSVEQPSTTIVASPTGGLQRLSILQIE